MARHRRERKKKKREMQREEEKLVTFRDRRVSNGEFECCLRIERMCAMLPQRGMVMEGADATGEPGKKRNASRSADDGRKRERESNEKGKGQRPDLAERAFADEVDDVVVLHRVKSETPTAQGRETERSPPARGEARGESVSLLLLSSLSPLSRGKREFF